MRAKIDGVTYSVLFSHCHVTDRIVPAKDSPQFVDNAGNTHHVWSTLETKIHGGSRVLRDLIYHSSSFAHRLRKSLGCTLCTIVEVVPGKPTKEGKILGYGISFCSRKESAFNKEKAMSEKFDFNDILIKPATVSEISKIGRAHV